ncbi:hypothetical protein DBP15_10565 [Streptomyces sp. CS065A]|nr:hypothetical protein DBP15_10565 [Streptomyces sp. CS065A]
MGTARAAGRTRPAPEQVDAVLPGPHRPDAEGDGPDDDDLTDTRRRVEKSSVIPWRRASATRTCRSGTPTSPPS